MGSMLTGEGSASPFTPNKPISPFGGAASNLRSRRRIGDPLFKLITGSFAVLIAGLAVLIMVEMAKNSSLPIAKFGFGFLSRSVWDPVAEQFGALPFIYGTVVSAVIALLISVPISLGVA